MDETQHHVMIPSTAPDLIMFETLLISWRCGQVGLFYIVWDWVEIHRRWEKIVHFHGNIEWKWRGWGGKGEFFEQMIQSVCYCANACGNRCSNMSSQAKLVCMIKWPSTLVRDYWIPLLSPIQYDSYEFTCLSICLMTNHDIIIRA